MLAFGHELARTQGKNDNVPLWTLLVHFHKYIQTNEIAWLFIICPLVCLSLQNYPQG